MTFNIDFLKYRKQNKKTITKVQKTGKISQATQRKMKKERVCKHAQVIQAKRDLIHWLHAKVKNGCDSMLFDSM